MKKTLFILTIIAFTIGIYSFKLSEQTGEWNIPDSAKNVKNPTDASDKENLQVGKQLYMKYCKSCHGKEGYGDGTKAAELEGDLGDFSSEEFHAQTDGELFYKITHGLEDMPNFDKKIPDAEDRWLIIDFVRTLEE